MRVVVGVVEICGCGLIVTPGGKIAGESGVGGTYKFHLPFWQIYFCVLLNVIGPIVPSGALGRLLPREHPDPE